MAWIYLLDSIPKKMKSKPPPLFQFFGHRDNNHDSHCALSEEEEGGIMFSYLYRGTIATGIVMSACSSLLMHSSNECAGVTKPSTIN
jgi:hypothetical protein